MLYTTIFGTNRHIQKATDHRLWKRITASQSHTRAQDAMATSGGNGAIPSFPVCLCLKNLRRQKKPTCYFRG